MTTYAPEEIDAIFADALPRLRALNAGNGIDYRQAANGQCIIGLDHARRKAFLVYSAYLGGTFGRWAIVYCVENGSAPSLPYDHPVRPVADPATGSPLTTESAVNA